MYKVTSHAVAFCRLQLSCREAYRGVLLRLRLRGEARLYIPIYVAMHIRRGMYVHTYIYDLPEGWARASRSTPLQAARRHHRIAVNGREKLQGKNNSEREKR